MQMYKYEYKDKYGIMLPYKRGRGSRGVVDEEVEFPLSPMMSATRESHHEDITG